MGKADAAAWLLESSPLGALLRRREAWQGVLTLNYHRIGDGARSPFDRGVWSATPEVLDAQLRFLKAHLDVIGPNDLGAVVRRGRGRYLLLTFDDGYRDHYEQAFPILRAHRAPAIFFLSTGFLDAPQVSWWDEIAWMVRASSRTSLPAGEWLRAPLVFDEPGRERAVHTLLAIYKALPGERTAAFLDFLAEATGSGRCHPAVARDTWLTWEMVREMRAAGLWFGGHTVTHPVLARLTGEQQRAEIVGCKLRLEAELGEPMRFFSYPVGSRDSFDARTRSCLQEIGVELAFSFYGGFSPFVDWDPYDVRRASVWPALSHERFRAMATLPALFARW